MEHHGLLQDATFWTAVSFVLFILLVVWKARGALSGAVNGRIERIKAELDQAQSLREEAEAALKDLKAKQANAAKEAEQIVEHAKAETKSLKSTADKRFKEAMARREQQAMDKIAQAEANAIQRVRAMAADMAIAATQHVLTERMSGADGDKAIEDAIGGISAKLN